MYNIYIYIYIYIITTFIIIHHATIVMFALEYPFIPVSQSSLLQLIKCRGFCVHPLYKDNICTADQYDSKSPAVSHAEDRSFYAFFFFRSSPAVVQWRPLDCVSYL